MERYEFLQMGLEGRRNFQVVPGHGIGPGNLEYSVRRSGVAMTAR